MALLMLTVFIGCIFLIPSIESSIGGFRDSGASPNYVHVPNCVATRILSPVCGTDGRNYVNISVLNCGQKLNPNLIVAHEGLCMSRNDQQMPMLFRPQDPAINSPLDSYLPPVQNFQKPSRFGYQYGNRDSSEEEDSDIGLQYL